MYTLRNLRRLRKLEGWSSRELGRYSGVSKNTISSLERLKRTAQSGTVECLARALKVHQDVLTGRPLPAAERIECPDYADLCIDGGDYVDTAETYEMGECIVLVRENRSGWVVTLFHPTRLPSWQEMEDTWDAVADPRVPWAAGLPVGIWPPREPWFEEAPPLTGRWNTGYEPYRQTLVQPRPVPLDEYEASEDRCLDSEIPGQAEDSGAIKDKKLEADEEEQARKSLPFFWYLWQFERLPFFAPDWVREQYTEHRLVWEEKVYDGRGAVRVLRLSV